MEHPHLLTVELAPGFSLEEIGLGVLTIFIDLNVIVNMNKRFVCHCTLGVP